MDPQQGRIVELKFFGGLSIDETAEVLSISHATVEREWKSARAWLRRQLEQWFFEMRFARAGVQWEKGF